MVRGLNDKCREIAIEVGANYQLGYIEAINFENLTEFPVCWQLISRSVTANPQRGFGLTDDITLTFLFFGLDDPRMGTTETNELVSDMYALAGAFAGKIGGLYSLKSISRQENIKATTNVATGVILTVVLEFPSDICMINEC